MGRIRTIKPEFTTDEELSSLPAETHLFAAGLLTYADDEGYFNAHPGLVKAAIFPIRETSVSVHGMLKQLQQIGFLRLGKTTDGKNWGHIVNFTIHQYVNRPKESKISCLDIDWDESVKDHGSITDETRQERKGKERNRDRAGALPDWVPEDAWNGWMEVRKKLKKNGRVIPWTARCEKIAIGKLEKWKREGFDLVTILDAATFGSWQGLWLPKDGSGSVIRPQKTWRTGDPNNPADWKAAEIPFDEALQ